MTRSKIFKDMSRIDPDESGTIPSCDTDRIDESAQSTSKKAHLDTLLDDALDETFPASDPISIDFEPPQSATRASKDPDDRHS